FDSAREMRQAWRALGPATETPRVQSSRNALPAYATPNHTRAYGLAPRMGLLFASFAVFACAFAIVLALHKPRTARRAADPTPTVYETVVTPLPSARASASAPALATSEPATIVTPVVEVVEMADAGRSHVRTHPSVPHLPRSQSSGTHFTTEPRY